MPSISENKSTNLLAESFSLRQIYSMLCQLISWARNCYLSIALSLSTKRESTNCYFCSNRPSARQILLVNCPRGQPIGLDTSICISVASSSCQTGYCSLVWKFWIRRRRWPWYVRPYVFGGDVCSWWTQIILWDYLWEFEAPWQLTSGPVAVF